MVKNCIKLYSAAVAGANNIATIIVPVTGQLALITWAHIASNAGAVGGGCTYQLSTMSTAQIGANDARGIIDEFTVGLNAAVGLFYATNKVTPVAGLKVVAGDNIYLHLATTTALATGVVNVNCMFV